MKKRYLVMLLLLSAILIIFTGCSNSATGNRKTPITMEQFTQIVKEKGYSLFDENYYSQLKSKYPLIKDVQLFEAGSDGTGWGLELVICENEEDAKEMYNTFVNNMESITADNMDVKKDSGSHYDVYEQTYSIENTNWYTYTARVDHTILAGSTLSDDPSEMKSFITEIGYPLP